MKLISEQQALARLSTLKAEFKVEIADGYEHRAKSCLTCETQGACCLDAHFVNVHISRLEAAAIREKLATLSDEQRSTVYDRIDSANEKYSLNAEGDTFAQTYACPLFEKGTGCLVHDQGKPLACIAHACYENEKDLPPDHLLPEQEGLVDELNRQSYGRPQQWLPIPLALRRT